MAAQNTFLTCPADCSTDLDYLAIDVDQDCAPALLKSEVSDLFFVPTGAADPFTNFATTPTYTASSIDNTDTTNAKTKHLVGIGDVPDPTETEVILPKGKVGLSDKTYTLNFTVMNMSDAQYLFLQQLQCGVLNFTFYYADRADKLFGIQGGIVPSSIRVRMPKARGEASTSQANIIITWTADGDPDRRTNPYN
jgi:hypothetical protein